MKVKFLPSGEEHEIEFNETVLHLAQRAGLHIQSVCKGIPSCAECRVQIKDGEHHVLPPNKKEIDLIGTAHYVDLSRLSCQLRCFGDVTIDLSEQIAKEARVKKKPTDRMARSDGQESKAVLGGILDNVVAEGVDLPDEVKDSVEKVKVDSFSGDPNLDKRDSFYGDFYTGKKKGEKNKGSKNKRRKGGKGQKSQGHKASASSGDKPREGQPKKKRQRRRRKPGQGRSAEATSQKN